MEKKDTHKLDGFVLGARPPHSLSPKAKRQLSRLKPSQKAHALAENAVKVMSTNGVMVPPDPKRIIKKKV